MGDVRVAPALVVDAFGCPPRWGDGYKNARRRLREPLSWCPDATWRISIAGRFRVLYAFDSEAVYILCIAEKGSETMEDATVIFAPKRSSES